MHFHYLLKNKNPNRNMYSFRTNLSTNILEPKNSLLIQCLFTSPKKILFCFFIIMCSSHKKFLGTNFPKHLAIASISETHTQSSQATFVDYICDIFYQNSIEFYRNKMHTVTECHSLQPACLKRSLIIQYCN